MYCGLHLVTRSHQIPHKFIPSNTLYLLKPVLIEITIATQFAF
ncbi:MAG: hypothetical protein ACJA1X_001150 [Bermanella sp.]|jgi:hypothetical protein